jgi:hypothetical protein
VIAVAEPDELVQAVLLGEYRAWAESALDGALGDYQPEAGGEYAAPAAYYAEPDGVLLLARLDGEPVGVIGVRLFFETSPRHSRPVFELARSLGFDSRPAREFAGVEGAVRMELELDCAGRR